MEIPAILKDDVGIMNFTLVKGDSKKIRATFSLSENIDISTWTFSIAFYVGRELEKTEIISTTAGIIVNGQGKYLVLDFSAATIADIPIGLHRWDLRYTVGADTGQLLKGQVTIAKV